MVDESELNEALSDAEAYFAAGHVDETIAVLFEALDGYGPQSEAAERVYSMLGGICCALWTKRAFALSKVATTRVVNEVLRRLGNIVEPGSLDIYVTACVATGTNPFPIRRLFRHQNLINVFHTVSDEVSGDVAECGCARGLSFLELCLDYGKGHFGWKGEGFHIFDSFEGLSKPTEEDRDVGQDGSNAALIAENMVAGHYAFSLELVAENVHRHFPRVQLHPGWIPSSFVRQPERAYRFVHIDVDLYQPTVDSLAYFFPRLAEGGIIITDDYNWPGAKRAFREFCDDRKLDLFTTDTSQAFLVKSGSPR